jgi:hypothetical protein
MVKQKEDTATKNKVSRLAKKEVRDDKHLFFSAFIIVITSLVVINTLFLIDNNTNLHIAGSKNQSKTVNINQVLNSQEKASSAVYEISVANATEIDKSDPGFRLESNQTLLIFDLTIKNKSSAQQDLIPVNQLYVRSNEGDFFTMHASSFVTRPLAAAKLKPGQTASGQVSFAVPKTLANPLVYVDLGWDNYVPVVFAVLK